MSPASLPAAVAFWNMRRGLIGAAACYDPGCGGSILATTDGGHTFRVILRTRRPVVHLQTAGSTGAIAELDGGSALRTSDGGRTWRQIRQLLSTTYATSAAGLRVRSRRCGNCNVLEVGRTSDGGSSWRYRRSPCPDSVSASGIVDLVTAQLGWLVCLGLPGMGNQAKAVYRTSAEQLPPTTVPTLVIRPREDPQSTAPLDGVIQQVPELPSPEVPEQPTPSPAVLTCVECLTVAEGHAGGWRAYLTDDEDQAVIYCPDCAEREFGDTP